MDLDGFDLALLDALQRDNQISSAALAEQVHLSPSACLRRMRDLRRRGVIRRDVALLDPAKVGRPLTILVLVALDTDNGETIRATADRLAGATAVAQCHYVTGEYDFAAVLHVASMAEYDAFLEATLLPMPHLKRFQTLVSLRTVKYETALPLDHLRAAAR